MSKKHFLFSFLLLIFPLFILFCNLKGVLYNCFNAYDLGIFQQAIYEMASNYSLNPFITVRGIKIFNDHFMPIIYFATPFVRLLNYHPFSMVIFEWCLYITFIFSALTIKYKETKNISAVLLVASMIIFTKAFLTGLIFPVHPSIWSMLPWLFLVYFIRKDNFCYIAILSFILCLFRESYAFSIFCLSIYYLFFKEYRRFFIILSISILFISFTFFLRPIFLGQTYDHGGHILQSLISSPFSFIIKRIIAFNYNGMGKTLYPFIIPLFLLNKYEIGLSLKKIKDIRILKQLAKHPITPVALLISPLVSIHFLTNKIDFHYTATFIAPILALFITSSIPQKIIKNRFLTSTIIILFFLSSMSFYKRFARIGILEKTHKCLINNEKYISTNKLIAIINNIDTKNTIISTRHIIPQIMRPNLKIYTTMHRVKHLGQYNYLLFEKELINKNDGINTKEFNNMLSDCQQNTIIYNDNYYLLLKGIIMPKCFNHLVNSQLTTKRIDFF